MEVQEWVLIIFLIAVAPIVAKFSRRLPIPKWVRITIAVSAVAAFFLILIYGAVG